MAPFDHYVPETATDFFGEIKEAAALAPNYAKVYDAYNHTFQKCLHQNTSRVALNLGGPFAKMDFLLKQHHAPQQLVKAVNDTRVRLRNRRQLAHELKQWYLLDLRHLCELVAMLYKAEIPPELVAQFPADIHLNTAGNLLADYLRIIVERWDDEYLYALPENTTDGKLWTICYARGNRNYPFDWTYLKGILRKGTQINLIKPRTEEGIVFPELIIYEPDFLVNISTVARCFTNYADSHRVDLIKKLEPSAQTEAITLGNLAGQLLDEAIQQNQTPLPYSESVRKFFKEHAIGMLTTPIGKEFHEEAQRQKANIARAVHQTLPEALSDFDAKEGIVEPTFFSEMLGLQGRMDYLTMDFKVLIEQKSGKGTFPYDHYVRPSHTPEHYVQMLLYMLLIRYNFRNIYEKNQRQLHAFLLYSKYEESLLGLGFSPELIFKALQIRNELAHAEISYAQPDGFRFLESLTAESFNEKQVNNALWHNYQRPQIQSVLSPIQEASPLERAYFLRFLTFVANEHLLSKLGNQTKENSGFAATWHDSLDDKREGGNIYDRLTILSLEKNEQNDIHTVVFAFDEKDSSDISNFRKGDVVLFYPYEQNQEPDARQTIVLRGTIADIGTESIRVILRAAQSDNRFFAKKEKMLWAVEHDFMEASYSGLYKGLHAFLTAPKERRDLLLLQRAPQTDTSVRLKGDYGDFNELSLRVKQAKDLFLIIGPPGTGKTSFGMLNTVKEQLLEENSTVLLMSYTNRAVDEICSKLSQEGIDFIRIGGKANCPQEYHDALLCSRAEKCRNLEQLKAELAAVRVCVGTTTSLSAHLPLFRLKEFDLAVIDEASQILEPHLAGLLSAQNNGVPALRKIVMIGDHKQLPAVVQQRAEVSQVAEAELQAIHLTDCRLSLFERMLRKYADHPEVVHLLHRQGRMHHEIAQFPSRTFYGSKLIEVPLPHQIAPLCPTGAPLGGIDSLLRTHRIAFVATEAPQSSISDKVNENEAEIIAKMVLKIYEHEKSSGFDAEKTIGIIVPYRNQIATVRNAIDRSGIKMLHHLTIDTVERYQGSQRKYIIYGFTIQKYYQLDFLGSNVFEDFDGSIVDRKLNVAMTRAEEHLFMVGNPAMLSRNYTFAKLLNFLKEQNCYFKWQDIHEKEG